MKTLFVIIFIMELFASSCFAADHDTTTDFWDRITGLEFDLSGRVTKPQFIRPALVMPISLYSIGKFKGFFTADFLLFHF